MDTALQAGWSVKLVDLQDIGTDGRGGFYDAEDVPMEVVLKLYPWEWMATSDYRDQLAHSPVRWVEPPWKAVLSKKAILPILWELFTGPPQPAGSQLRCQPLRRPAACEKALPVA